MRRELSTAQPELSNEVLPPDSDFVVPEPRGARGVGGVGAGDCLGLTGAGLMGVGVGVARAETGAAGVATATAGVLGAADATAGRAAGVVVEAARWGVARAGRTETAATWTAIGGELARRTGIAGPVEAVETLDGSCSRGALAGRSERPISKKHANTATHSSIVTTITRAYVATGPRSESNDVEMRTVFMTDRRAGWFPPG